MCKSSASRIASIHNDATRLDFSKIHTSPNDIDVFADMDEDTLATLNHPPPKRINMEDPLLAEATKETQKHHTMQRMSLLNLF